jgi:NADH-quinone oxidoreductase subunit H
VDLATLIEAVVKVHVVLGFVLLGVPLIVWMERKVLGHMQDRIGPQRVGPYGLLQTIADGIKLFMKEDIIPAQADKVVYFLAPGIAVVTALAAMTVIPFGDSVWLFGREIPLRITDVNIAVLSSSSARRRWASTGSCWVDGPPTPSTRYWGGFVPPRR